MTSRLIRHIARAMITPSRPHIDEPLGTPAPGNYVTCHREQAWESAYRRLVEEFRIRADDE